MTPPVPSAYMPLRGISARPLSTGRGRTRRDRESRQLADAQVGTSGIPRSMGALSLTGISQRLRRKLSVLRGVDITSTSGAYSSFYCVVNTGYGVDGTSLVPAGYNKLMAFYTKAWVLSARWRIHVINTTVGGTSVAVGYAVRTNTTPFTSFDALVENGLCKWTTVQTNPDSTTFTGAVDNARFLGKPVYLDDPQLYSTATAPVAQQVVLHIGAIGLGGATVTTRNTLEIEFDMVFTDPIPFT